MMNAKVKTMLILLATLILGVAIGFEISEISIKKRFERMESFRAPQGFVNIFEKVIQPDSIQQPVVDSILIQYHVRIEKITTGSMREITQKIDSMIVDLKKVLNKEQNERLDKELARMKSHQPPGVGRPPMSMPLNGKGMQPPAEGKRLPPPNGEPFPPPDGKRFPPPNGNR